MKHIRGFFNINEKISFAEVTEDKARKRILHLDCSNATPVGDIFIDILKLTVNVHFSNITKIINLSLRNYYSPNDLKSAEVSRIFERDDDLERELQTCQYSISRVKGLWENDLYSYQKLHGKQIVSVTSRL